MAAFTDSIFQLFTSEISKVQDEEARRCFEKHVVKAVYEPYRQKRETGKLKQSKSPDKVKQEEQQESNKESIVLFNC